MVSYIRGFFEKIWCYHKASTHSGEFIWYCEKVVSTGEYVAKVEHHSTGFEVPAFDAVGTPISTKYIITGGLLWELTKTKAGADMCPSGTETG